MRLQIVILREKNPYDTIQYKLNGIEFVANQLANTLGDTGIGLVVAPEYHFRNPGPLDARNCHVTLEVKDAIKSYMTKLSQIHKKVIFVPGTIAWKQPAVERPRLLLDISMQGLGYFQQTQNQQVGPFDKTVQVLSQLWLPQLQVMRDILYNTAYIYVDGDAVGVDKEGDYQESSFGRILVHEKGVLVNDLMVNGQSIRLGVEICYDHFFGRLRSYVARKEVPPVPDIHVLVSAWVLNHPENFCVRPGGVVVHASTVERGPVTSSRYEAVSYGGPPSIWDNRKKVYTNPKNSLHFDPTKLSNSSLTFPSLGGPPVTIPRWVAPVTHNKRVTNVFQQSGVNQWTNQKVRPTMGDFYTLVEVDLNQ